MSQFGGGPPDQEKLKQHLEEWLAKLVGKKIVDTAVAEDNALASDSVSRNDLPKGTRVIRPGDPVTMDFRPERMNVQLDENDVCQSVGMF